MMAVAGKVVIGEDGGPTGSNLETHHFSPMLLKLLGLKRVSG